MKTAIFLGMPQQLAPVYPPGIREEIGRIVRILPGDIDGARWTGSREALSEAALVFATWGMPRLDAEFLEAAPGLEAVFYAAGSVKGFATPEAAARGIIISSAAEANAIPVAEYSLGVILLALKGVWPYVRSGLPAEFRHAATPVAGAYGSTVGLVSLGAIGRRVARLLAENHEVRLLVHDPHLPDGEASAHHAEPASLPDVFSRSDVVSIHTPWLPETEKMVGADLVLSMKPGATLLNTSRGAVIDEDGLCEALRLRPDITAILDVTHPEPPAPDSALRSLPNVFLTPHIAGSTGPEVARMGRWMLEEARRHLAGEPLRHRIDPDRLALMA